MDNHMTNKHHDTHSHILDVDLPNINIEKSIVAENVQTQLDALMPIISTIPIHDTSFSFAGMDHWFNRKGHETHLEIGSGFGVVFKTKYH